MLMTKNIIIYGILACISTLQAGCMQNNPKDVPAEATVVEAQPSCDPLGYYNGLAQADDKTSATETNIWPVESSTNVCLKLRKAIRLSMPGCKQQNDKKALVILKDLEHSRVLSDSDLRFNNMLLQHVSQRQTFRTKISSQEQRLVKIEAQNTVLSNQLKTLQSQLDQLKNIEVEIDKKERSVTSPTDQ